MDMYEQICEKLGVDIDNYKFHVSDTEDDNDYDNIPYYKLSLEELDFLWHRRLKQLGLE